MTGGVSVARWNSSAHLLHQKPELCDTAGHLNTVRFMLRHPHRVMETIPGGSWHGLAVYVLFGREIQVTNASKVSSTGISPTRRVTGGPGG